MKRLSSSFVLLLLARLQALQRSLTGEIRAAEAMVNTTLARDVDLPVPPLAPLALTQPVPSWAVLKPALASRPELAAGRAEIVRAQVDVQVMRYIVPLTLVLVVGLLPFSSCRQPTRCGGATKYA